MWLNAKLAANHGVQPLAASLQCNTEEAKKNRTWVYFAAKSKQESITAGDRFDLLFVVRKCLQVDLSDSLQVLTPGNLPSLMTVT